MQFVFARSNCGAILAKARSWNINWSLQTLITNFALELAGLDETKAKPSPLLKVELKLGLNFAI